MDEHTAGQWNGSSGTEWERRSGIRARRGSGVIVRVARVTAWSIVHFCAAFAQQLAELLAPLLLIVGIGWYVLPKVIGLVQTDDAQVRDILNGMESHVPNAVVMAGHRLSASGLILDGIVLMVVAAALATATTVIGNELYRER